MKLVVEKNYIDIPVIDKHGRILSYQRHYFMPLANKKFADRLGINGIRIIYHQGRKTTPDVVFLKDSEGLDDDFLSSGHQYTIAGIKTIIHFNVIWGSSIKKQTLTGVSEHIRDFLLHLFNYSESAIRAGSALLTNGWTGGYFENLRLKIVEVNTEDGMFFVGDGANYIRESFADQLKRKINVKPYNMDTWKLGVQSLQQITSKDDQEKVFKELLPGLKGSINLFNNNGILSQQQEFLQSSSKLLAAEEVMHRILEANPEMATHPFMTEVLSLDRAKMIYEALTTGANRSTKGFVAFPTNLPGIVLPAGINRFNKDEEYTVIRFPGDSPFANNIYRNYEHPRLAEYLANYGGFQNRIIWKTDTGDTNFSKGMTYIVPNKFWPKEWENADIVISSEDIKASTGWNSPEDIQNTRSTFGEFKIDGIITAINWADKGNMVAIPYKGWKQQGGDYDGDLGGIRAQRKLPALTAAVKRSIEEAKGHIKKAKLTKTYTFNGNRTQALKDSMLGGKLVGLWSNVATVMAHTDPTFHEDIFELLEVAKTYEDFVEKGAFEDDEENHYWMMMRIISLGIQAGTDGFKTDLSGLGGMEYLASLASSWSAKLRDAGITTPVLTHNPKRSPFAFRDDNNKPEYEEDYEPYGISAMLMHAGITGNKIDVALELPEYFNVGAPLEGFKYYAIAPHNSKDLKAARKIRTVIRKELAARNMTEPAQWVQFIEGFLKPLLEVALTSGLVADWWEPENPLDKNTKYKPINPEKFSGIIGERYYLANILWYAFHDNPKTSAKGNYQVTSSIAPLVWMMPEEVIRIVGEKPGLHLFKKTMNLTIVDTNKPQNGYYEDTSIAIKKYKKENEGAIYVEERAYLSIGDKQYLLAKDTPLLRREDLVIEITNNKNITVLNNNIFLKEYV